MPWALTKRRRRRRRRRRRSHQKIIESMNTYLQIRQITHTSIFKTGAIIS
jgi:hypothetical protein